MKKILGLLLITSCFLLFACSNKNTQKVVDRIEITTNPTKMEYVVGEKFQKSGMVVTAYYDDSSSEEVFTYEISKTSSLYETDTEITIAYHGKFATIQIIVISKTLVSIKIEDNPNKTEYNIGEIFNADGLKLKLTYNDDSVQYVTSGFTYPTTPLEIGTKKITISYNGKTTSVNITVK